MIWVLRCLSYKGNPPRFSICSYEQLRVDLKSSIDALDVSAVMFPPGMYNTHCHSIFNANAIRCAATSATNLEQTDFLGLPTFLEKDEEMTAEIIGGTLRSTVESSDKFR